MARHRRARSRAGDDGRDRRWVRDPARVVAGPAARAPVLQWFGRHSYALYLWHWPVLVLADARWGPLNWFQRLVAVAVAVGLSALSLRFVENPVRHARRLAASRPAAWRSGRRWCSCDAVAGWALARSIPPFDGGAAAATPDLVGGRRAAP